MIIALIVAALALLALLILAIIFTHNVVEQLENMRNTLAATNCTLAALSATVGEWRASTWRPNTAAAEARLDQLHDELQRLLAEDVNGHDVTEAELERLFAD